MSHQVDLIYIDEDERIALYQRSDVKRGVWQARFRLPDQTKYKRVSTKLKDLEKAKAWALTEYIRLGVRVNEQGEALVSYGFKELATRWLEDRKIEYETKQCSKGTYDRDAGTLKRYLVPFFKSNKVNNINQQKLDEYIAWRIDYWVNGPGKDKPHRSQRIPSPNTLRQESIPLKLILKKAVKLGQYKYDKLAQLEWSQQKMVKNRREAFEKYEWLKIRAYMQRNDWINHKHPRIRYDRQLLRDYMYVMKNTGMRVGEARYLKWKDIKSLKAKNGQSYWVCYVDGKRGKRTVICNDGIDIYFDRIKLLTGKDKPYDYVWVNYWGEHRKDFAVGFKSLVKTVLGYDAPHTLYSLRHTYATIKIAKENMNTKKLAELMGTSVDMIDQHYGHYSVNDYGEQQAESRAYRQGVD